MSGCVRSRECVELRQETVLAQMRKEMSKHYLPEKEEQLQCMTSFRSEPVSTQVEYGAAQCRAKQFYTERFLKNSLLSTLSTKIAPLFFFLLFPKNGETRTHTIVRRGCAGETSHSFQRGTALCISPIKTHFACIPETCTHYQQHRQPQPHDCTYIILCSRQKLRFFIFHSAGTPTCQPQTELGKLVGGVRPSSHTSCS